MVPHKIGHNLFHPENMSINAYNVTDRVLKLPVLGFADVTVADAKRII